MIMKNVYENSEEIREYFDIPSQEFNSVLIMRRKIYLSLFPADANMITSAMFGAMLVGPLNKAIFPDHDYMIIIEDSLINNEYCYKMAQAVIYHELGHFHYKHKSTIGLDGTILDIVNNKELFDRQEIEADMYAVDHGCGKGMLSFLCTLIRLNKKYQCLHVDNIKHRIRALRKTLSIMRLRSIKTWRL